MHVDILTSKLQQDFKSHIEKMSSIGNPSSSLNVLTQEELTAIEKVWIELTIWKKELSQKSV